MIIHHITPFSTSKNIGKEYNERISELPKDCYICLRDGDTMFLTPDWGRQIEDIIKANPDYSVITCMTNRIGLKELVAIKDTENSDMAYHIEVAKTFWEGCKTLVIDTPIAPGMLMIFHKSVWQNNPFKENSIYFDREFSKSVIKNGGKIGVALGLYVFHLYRWGQRIPQLYTEHLR